MNKKKIVFFLLLLFLITIAYVFFEKGNKKIEIPKEVGLEEIVGDIEDVQKGIFIASKKGTEEEVVDVSLASLKAWEVFVTRYKNEQPEEYKKTKSWDRKMLKILEHERKANEYLLEKRYEDSKKEKAISDEMYRTIKKENDIFEISKEMKEFYESMEKVIEADTKEEIENIFPILKLRFTILKEIGIDSEYDEFIGKMEEHIAKLDKFLDGPDFKKAQKELEDAFFEFYKKY